MADQISFGIKLTLDGRVMVGQIDVSKAKLKEFGDAADAAGKKATDGLKKVEDQSKSTANALTGALTTMRSLAAGVGAFQIVQHLSEASDYAKLLQARLALVTTGIYEQSKATAELFAIAQQLQLPYAELSATYPRLARAIREYGGSTRDALDITKLFAQTVRVSGATTAEAAASALQFSQAIGSGRLAGDELRSVLENNSRLASALAAGLNVTVGELRHLGEEGKLTSEKVIRALLSQKDVLEREAASLPRTIKGSWTELANEADKATTSSTTLNTVAALLAGSLRGVGDAIKYIREQGSIEIPSFAILKGISGLTHGRDPNASNVFDMFFGKGTRKADDGSFNRAEDARFGRQAETFRASDAAQAASERAFRDLTKEAETAAGVNARYTNSVDKVIEVWRQMAAAGTLTAEKQKELTAQIVADGVKRDVAISELAKKGQVSFGAQVALIEQQKQLRQSQYSTLDAMEKDAFDRSEKRLEVSHQNQLVSERSYIAQRDALARASAEQHLKNINDQIAAEEAARARIAAIVPRDATERAEKTAKLAEEDRRLAELTVQRTKAERDLGDVAIHSRERTYAMDLKIFEIESKILFDTADYLKKLQDETDEERFQLSLIGQTAEAQAAATAARRVELDVEKEVLAIRREISALEVSGADPQLIASRNRQIDQIKEAGKARVQSARDLATETTRAGEATGYLSDAWHQVDDTLYQTLQKARTGWRDAAKYAADQIKNFIFRALYELTLQRFAMNVFANVTGAGGGVFAGSTPATGALSALSGGGALSGAGSLLSSGAASLFGESFAMAAGGGFSAGLSTLGIAAQAGASAVGGFSAVLGAAIPVIGWVVAIGSILYSIFGSKGGGRKAEGGASGSFDAAGKPLLNSGSESLFGNISGGQYNKQAEDVVKSEAARFYATLNALDGKTSGVNFGFKISADPAGDAGTVVDAVSRDASGNVLYHSARDAGRDDKDVTAALAEEATRALLAALQASDLPPTVAKIINSLDVKTASQKAIDDAINLAVLFGSMLKEGSRNIATDAAELYKAQSRSAYESMKAQGAALTDLANKFDGSAEKAQELAAAQTSYRQSVLQLLAGIKALTVELHAMFLTTREHIERAGLTDQETYNYLQRKADRDFAILKETKDPAEVQRLAREINAYYTEAFDLLSPEEQLAHKKEFLSHLDLVDTTVADKLHDMFDSISEEAKAPFEVVATKLDAAADKFADGAKLFADAVNRDANNRGTPGTSTSTGSTPVVFVSNPAARYREAGV